MTEPHPRYNISLPCRSHQTATVSNSTLEVARAGSFRSNKFGLNSTRGTGTGASWRKFVERVKQVYKNKHDQKLENKQRNSKKAKRILEQNYKEHKSK